MHGCLKVGEPLTHLFQRRLRGPVWGPAQRPLDEVGELLSLMRALGCDETCGDLVFDPVAYSADSPIRGTPNGPMMEIYMRTMDDNPVLIGRGGRFAARTGRKDVKFSITLDLDRVVDICWERHQLLRSGPPPFSVDVYISAYDEAEPARGTLLLRLRASEFLRSEGLRTAYLLAEAPTAAAQAEEASIAPAAFLAVLGMPSSVSSSMIPDVRVRLKQLHGRSKVWETKLRAVPKLCRQHHP